jgi:hypothetical protein
MLQSATPTQLTTMTFVCLFVTFQILVVTYSTLALHGGRTDGRTLDFHSVAHCTVLVASDKNKRLNRFQSSERRWHITTVRFRLRAINLSSSLAVTWIQAYPNRLSYFDQTLLFHIAADRLLQTKPLADYRPLDISCRDKAGVCCHSVNPLKPKLV